MFWNYQDGQQAIGSMTVPEGFEINLFADEKRFPELVNPVQLSVDTKGRLWAATWKTYPKWEPLKERKFPLKFKNDTKKPLTIFFVLPNDISSSFFTHLGNNDAFDMIFLLEKREPAF